MIKAFDTSTPLTIQTAQRAKAAGYECVGRYLGTPGSWKLLTPGEARIISDAGLMLFCYFERAAGRALEGKVAGVADATLAINQAEAIGQRLGTGITFTVDIDAAPSSAIVDYFLGVRLALDGYYRAGIYGGGDVIKAVRGAGFAEFGILAGAMGWRGSRAYLDSGLWQGRQYPATRSGEIGIEIDPVDLVGLAEVGAWSLASVAASADHRVNPPERRAVSIDSAIRMLQEALGVTVDGDFGPRSQAALAVYRARK